MDIESLKDAFWHIVADCLERFHAYERSVAWLAALDLRDEIESPSRPPSGYEPDLFYHGEPFYIACDIAGRQLDLPAHRTEYDCIVGKRYREAERLMVAADTRS
jgi:hypothetical protein